MNTEHQDHEQAGFQGGKLWNIKLNISSCVLIIARVLTLGVTPCQPGISAGKLSNNFNLSQSLHIHWTLPFCLYTLAVTTLILCHFWQYLIFLICQSSYFSQGKSKFECITDVKYDLYSVCQSQPSPISLTETSIIIQYRYVTGGAQSPPTETQKLKQSGFTFQN